MREQVGSLFVLSAGKRLGRREFRARLVQAGPIRTADGRPGDVIIPAGAIAQAVAEGLFDGLAVFLDHGDGPGAPRLRHLVAVTHSARFAPVEGAAEATLRFYDRPAEANGACPSGEERLATAVADTLEMILADRDRGLAPPDIGISLVFWPEWAPAAPPAGGRVLRAFGRIESADLVFSPAAGGRILALLSTHNHKGENEMSQVRDPNTLAADAAAGLNPAPTPQPESGAAVWQAAGHAANVEAILRAAALP
ncbi:MAG: hypothetical protein ACRDHL_13750, partial [Candidatus Promineifilaceae bacterium]